MFYTLFTEIVCGGLPNGTNTDPVNSSLIMTYLDIYVYTCLPGFTTTDEVITLCAPDGNFTMPYPPNCTSKSQKILYNVSKYIAFHFNAFKQAGKQS